MCPVRNGRYFSYIIYKGKMGQKWPKKTIKWQKNGPIDPKFGNILHLWEFYEF